VGPCKHPWAGPLWLLRSLRRWRQPRQLQALQRHRGCTAAWQCTASFRAGHNIVAAPPGGSTTVSRLNCVTSHVLLCSCGAPAPIATLIPPLVLPVPRRGLSSRPPSLPPLPLPLPLPPPLPPRRGSMHIARRRWRCPAGVGHNSTQGQARARRAGARPLPPAGGSMPSAAARAPQSSSVSGRRRRHAGRRAPPPAVPGTRAGRGSVLLAAATAAHDFVPFLSLPLPPGCGHPPTQPPAPFHSLPPPPHPCEAGHHPGSGGVCGGMVPLGPAVRGPNLARTGARGRSPLAMQPPACG
jgi:hypothetical protein